MDTCYTKGDYKRLGDRIRNNPLNVASGDLEILQFLRMSYKDVLSAVFSVLVDEARRVDKKAISTYRVKRIESIISKLQREPKMQLHRMSDIAGCRCILQNDNNVYALKNRLEKRLNVKHINDYIVEKKATGYRSLHLIVTVQEYATQPIEIQLRCLKDHNWATLVEITDLVYNTKIKEQGSDGELAEFHQLLSDAYEQYFSLEQKRRIIEIAQKHNYFQKITDIFNKNYIDVRRKWNESRQSNHTFFLISTDSSGSPEIESFLTFDAAESAYFIKYSDNANKSNIVLTHVKDVNFDAISLAYSNYFLTYNSLLIRCYWILSDLVVDSYSKDLWRYFKNVYTQFLQLTNHMLCVHMADVIEYRDNAFAIKSAYKRTEWAGSIKKHLNDLSRVFNQTHYEIYKNGGHFICSTIKKHLYKKFASQEVIPYKPPKK